MWGGQRVNSAFPTPPHGPSSQSGSLRLAQSAVSWGEPAPRGSWRGSGVGGVRSPSVENGVTEWESGVEAEPHPHLVPVWELGALCGNGGGFLPQPHTRVDIPMGPRREPLWGVNSIKCRHLQSGAGNGVPVREEDEPYPHTWAGRGEPTWGEQRSELLMRASGRGADGNPTWGEK